MGTRFVPAGLARFTVQVGEPDKGGVRFDVCDARVTNDPNKTFILGTDIMTGTRDQAMLPWKLDFSGRVEIGLRRKDLPWTVFSPLRMPEEFMYRPSWDDKEWNPRKTKGKKGGAVNVASG